MNLRALVVCGSIHEVPEETGAADIVTFISILLRVRDPFPAMAVASRSARESLVAGERVPEQAQTPDLTAGLGLSFLSVLPDPGNMGPSASWWFLTPQVVCWFAEAPGFGDTSIRYFEVPPRW